MISQIIWFLGDAADLIWFLGDFSARNHTILGDLGFYPLRDFSPISRREITSVN